MLLADRFCSKRSLKRFSAVGREERPREKRKRRSENSTAKVTTLYDLRGRGVCQSVSVAVVKLYRSNINSHASAVVQTEELKVYTTSLNKSRKGKRSTQTIAALLFPERYRELNEMR